MKKYNSENFSRYKVDVTTYVNKRGSIYIVETTYDTMTGKVVARNRFYHTNYGKKKK